MARLIQTGSGKGCSFNDDETTRRQGETRNARLALNAAIRYRRREADPYRRTAIKALSNLSFSPSPFIYPSISCWLSCARADAQKVPPMGLTLICIRTYMQHDARARTRTLSLDGPGVQPVALGNTLPFPRTFRRRRNVLPRDFRQFFARQRTIARHESCRAKRSPHAKFFTHEEK